MEKAYCQKCKTELEVVNGSVMPCTNCGSKSFIAGNIVSQKDGWACTCGDTSFKMKMHLNLNPNHQYIYECRNCGNTVHLYNHNEEEGE